MNSHNPVLKDNLWESREHEIAGSFRLRQAGVLFHKHELKIIKINKKWVKNRNQISVG